MISGLPFRWHLPEVAAVLTLAVAVLRLHLPTRERRHAIGALVALVVVLVWPYGDLASQVSLTAAVLQRLVIMLVVVPLLLGAVPVTTLDRLTRPWVLDRPVQFLSRPGVAIVVVTVLGSVTVSPIIVDWGARSEIGHLCALAMTTVAGIVLWLPGLGVVPGTRHLSPTGRAGYVFIASVVVTVLSFVWIFLRHPIYPGLAHQQEVLHISALLDQQLAGFAAKLGAYGPMWVVAYVIFFRADEEGRDVEESPLHWADVERHLLRADRVRARAAHRRRRSG